MRNFGSDNARGRGGGFGRNRSGGRSERGEGSSRGGGFNRGRERFGGERRESFGNRSSGSFERRRPEMHEVTCTKCGQQCEVPFKPTGDKPVFCSDCFKKQGNSSSGSRNSFDSRNRSSASPSVSSSGISQEQFKQINTKLDKIISILDTLEFEDDEEDGEGFEDEDELEEKPKEKKNNDDFEEESEEDEDEEEEEEVEKKTKKRK